MKSQVELIVGPYRSGKTELVLKELIEHSRQKPLMNSLIMVPSARYRTVLNGRIKQLVCQVAAGTSQNKPRGIFGLNILPFYQVCQMVLSMIGAGGSLIPDKLRAKVVTLVLDDLIKEKQLNILEPIAGFAGTSPALLELIDAFERAGISPETVAGRLSRTKPTGYHMELARVYDGYWKKLDELELLDQRRLAFLACEALKSKEIADLQFDWLICDGFDRISGLQAQVIEGLSKHAEQTRLLFDFEPEQEAVLKQYQWKERGYIDLVNTLKPKMRSVEAVKVAAIRKTETFSALDRFVEMQEIARRVKQQIVENGRRPQDILVIARQIEPYRAAVTAAFEGSGVPYFMDEGIALAELPLIQFLLRLIKLPVNDFKRFDVVACLRSPFFNREQLGINAEQVIQIDNLSLEKQLVAGKDRWQRVLKKEPELAALMTKLCDAVSPPSEFATITEYCEWLENLIDQLLTRSKNEDGSAEVFKGYDGRAMLEVRNSIALLLQEDRVFAGSGAGKISYTAFVEDFERLIDESNFRSQADFREYVTICGAELAPNRSFEAVFVAGLIEGEFPMRSGGSGFAGGEELAAWARLGIEIDNPRSHPTYEWALYRAQIDRAKGYVCLSYPHYELSGEECVPSFFLKEMKQEAPSKLLAPYENSLAEPTSPADALSGWLWKHEAENAAECFADVPLVAELEFRLSPLITQTQMRILGGDKSIYNGWLVDAVEAGVLKVDMPDHFSASRLNDYGKCPFRYWVSHVLGLEPRQEPESGLSPKLLGNLHHFILETFFKQLAGKGIDLYSATESDIGNVLEAAIATGWSWIERRDEFIPGKFWKYEQEDIAFRLRRLVARERERGIADKERFMPHMFEASFGRNETRSLVIAGVGGAVSINGQIDRLDMGSDQRVRLIDYKTSTQSISKQEALDGRNLQLPLYALAVEKAIMPGSHVAKAMYVSVNSGEVVGQLDFDSQSDEDHVDILRRTEEYVQGFVQSMKQGDFRVAPNGARVCVSCMHKKTCRINELLEVEEDHDESD